MLDPLEGGGDEPTNQPQRAQPVGARGDAFEREEIHRASHLAAHQDRKTDTRFHAGQQRDRGPHAVSDFAQIGNEDQIPLLPGAATQADAFLEVSLLGDPDELIIHGTRVDRKNKGAAGRVDRPK